MGIVGGSLPAFAISASFFTDVNLVAVVGDDFTDEHMQVFADRQIDLTGVQRAKGKTFRWGAEYGHNLASRETLYTELNVLEDFQPLLPETYKRADVIYLANAHPSHQLGVLDQTTSKRVVGMDTIKYWIENTSDELRETLKHVDILKIDDSEARELSGEYNLRKAAAAVQAMGPKTVIATRGAHGSTLFSEHDIFAVTAYPLEDEVDPTGAGDSFAGGFFGYLAQKPMIDAAVLRRAVIFGSVMGAFCVEGFGTRRLERLTLDEIFDRYREIKRLTHFEDV